MIINSWDTTDMADSAIRIADCIKLSSGQKLVIWDLVHRQILYYEGECKHIIPFCPELDINDDALRRTIDALYEK